MSGGTSATATVATVAAASASATAAATAAAATEIGVDVAAGAVADTVATAGATAAEASFGIGDLMSAFSVVSTLASGAGAIMSGRAQAQNAAYQSAIASQNQQIGLMNATQAEQEGSSQQQQQQLQTAAQVGAIKASEAGSGIDVNSGSALDVQSSAKALGELSALNIGYSAQTKANAYVAQAGVAGAQSSMYGAQETPDIIGGFLNPNSSLIGTIKSTANSGQSIDW